MMGWREKCEDRWICVGAGIAAAIVGKKILNSKSVRDAAVKGMASTMKFQQDAIYKLEVMKEEAQDIIAKQDIEATEE